MSAEDVEPVDPTPAPWPPGGVDSALTTFVRDSLTELPALTGTDRLTAHRYFDDFALRRLPDAIRAAQPADHAALAGALAPLADLFATAGGLVRLSRDQARGRAGDFETIEYILRRRPGGVPGSLGWLFDDYLLHAPITDQHRNKIAHQAALIEDLLAAGAGREARRVLLIAAGGAADLRRVDPARLRPGDTVVLNDVDPDALDHAVAHLPEPTRARTVTVPGNVLRKAAEIAADHGPFDLVLAGGLFDYLDQRPARALIRSVLTRLCRPGGTFYFSNITAGNPYGQLMTHVGRWRLVERSEADIEADVHAATAPGTVARLDIGRDPTGLALLATVRRSLA